MGHFWGGVAGALSIAVFVSVGCSSEEPAAADDSCISRWNCENDGRIEVICTCTGGERPSCLKLGDNDEACGPSAGGLACSYSFGCIERSAGDWRCTPQAYHGEPCGLGGCYPPLVCLNGTCEAGFVKQGERCEGAGYCEDNGQTPLFCDQELGDGVTYGLCAPLFSARSFCHPGLWEASCSGGTTCIGNFCEQPLASGEPCTADTQCEYQKRCENGFCDGPREPWRCF